MRLIRLLVGRILPNRRTEERKLTAVTAVPAMGLDGLGSSAYGPEAALKILLPLGAAGLAHIVPIIAMIVVLLGIVFVSYWQTIEAYPNNGGAYVVARENLGRTASLVAAAALMIDYVLNVAVGISAGVGALVSAVPALHPYIVELCLALLVGITIVNLRGTLDAGRLFAVPAYIFVASFLMVLGIGVVRTVGAAGAPVAIIPPPALPDPTEAVSLWILLRAFASGCTAMTGVEAVSNGVGAFKEPRIRHAHRTLVAIVAILALLLIGIGGLVHVFGIGAMDQTQPGYQSIVSQLAAAIAGRGVLYDVVLGSLLCVLACSANTSFVDFPRMCRTVATDDYLPRAFAIVGRRLVFSVGILYLALTAGILLVAFGGITEHLIPLFAIGAFLTFTLSQSGMVMHWLRTGRHSHAPRWRLHLAINAVGATATGLALAIIIVTKFVDGAWITLLVIPLVVLLLRAVRSYYDDLSARSRDGHALQLTRREPPIILVATETWNRIMDRAISFALQLSPDVYAVHVVALEGPDSDSDGTLRAKWSSDVETPARRAGLKPPRLLVLHAEYRRMHEPLLVLVREIERDFPERTIAILVPELIKTSWWQYLLHTQRARRLRKRLLRFGGSHLVIINIPWYLEEPDLDEAISEAEAARAP
ncbi:MAG: APC family permease [Kofleriaceae bacterium]